MILTRPKTQGRDAGSGPRQRPLRLPRRAEGWWTSVLLHNGSRFVKLEHPTWRRFAKTKKRWFCKRFTTFLWFLPLPNQPINQFVSFRTLAGKARKSLSGMLQSAELWQLEPSPKAEELHPEANLDWNLMERNDRSQLVFGRFARLDQGFCKGV